MHTNLYTTLDEARLWAKARNVTLSLSMAATGLVIKGFKPPAATPGTPLTVGREQPAPPETMQWTVDPDQVIRGFAIDPPPVLGQAPSEEDQLGARLQTLLGGPLGTLRLAAALANDADPLTVDIIAQAAFCRAEEAAGREVDPWEGMVTPPPPPAPVNIRDLLKSSP